LIRQIDKISRVAYYSNDGNCQLAMDDSYNRGYVSRHGPLGVNSVRHSKVGIIIVSYIKSPTISGSISIH
jgi:hypothetical protein